MEIIETKKTPYVLFDEKNCILKVSGDSYGEDIVEVYIKINKWINQILSKRDCKLVCIFKYNILNSITYKYLNLIFKDIEIKTGFSNIEINWYYDENDEDIFEIAEDFEAIFDIEINKIAM